VGNLLGLLQSKARRSLKRTASSQNRKRGLHGSRT
jgi:hypothetical protein